MKKRKDFAWAELLTTILVLVGIGILGWRLFPVLGYTPNAPLERVVQQASDSIPSEFPDISYAQNLEDTGTLVIYKVDGYDFFTGVIVEQSLSARFDLIHSMWRTDFGIQSEKALKKIEKEEKESLRPVKQRVVDHLLENGFTKAADYPDKDVFTNMIFARSDAVCNVNEYNGTIYLDCASIEQLAQSAERARPFADAYQAKHSDTDNTSSFFKLEEQGFGRTNNDSYALVSTGNIGAYFYQDKDDTWVHYGNSYEGLGCADIKNDAASDAFAMICRPADAKGF